jgi:hypothetical protein
MNLNLDLTRVLLPSRGHRTPHWILAFCVWLFWKESYHKSLFIKWPDSSNNISERPEIYCYFSFFTNNQGKLHINFDPKWQKHVTV